MPIREYVCRRCMHYFWDKTYFLGHDSGLQWNIPQRLVRVLASYTLCVAINPTNMELNTGFKIIS